MNVPRQEEKIISFSGHQLDTPVRERATRFIIEKGFPVSSIAVDRGQNSDSEGKIIKPKLSAQIFVSEPITEQERYRLTQQLDHDVLIGVSAEDMKIIIDQQDLEKDSFDQHRQILQRRLIGALDYDIEMQSALGGHGRVWKIQLAPIGFFRRMINKSGALDLLLPTGDPDVQERVLDFSRAMDTYGRIVRVGLRKTHRASLFQEVTGGIRAR